jgi:hypothetical protein
MRSGRRIAVWVAGIIAFLAATNLYSNPVDDYQRYADGYSDSFSYMAMAEAAPGLPSESFPFHHAQRIAIPYVVGLAHDATGATTHALFMMSVVVFGVGTLTVLAKTLGRIGAPWPHVVIVIAILALNPWTFRPYVAYPELVDDMGFVFGLSIITYALVTGRVGVLIAGQLVAAASRQTAVLLLPMIFAALWWAEPFVHQPVRKRALAGAIIAVATAAIYLWTAQVARQFGQPNMNAAHVTGILTWARTSFDAKALIKFLMAAGEAPFVALAILGFAMMKVRRRPQVLSLCLMLGTLAIWAQPVLAGPSITGGNIQRLITLGLVPLLVAVAIVLREADPSGDRVAPATFAGAVLLALASMHHHYIADWLPFFDTNRLSIALFLVGTLSAVGLVATRLRLPTADSPHSPS